MYLCLLSPLAPLVLRTGRPFGETGGEDSYPFPMPSTIAGALRAACADERQLDFAKERTRILGWACHGALPVELAGTRVTPLFPRPADARYARHGANVALQQFAPCEPMADEGMDLPSGLWPVMLREDDRSKPADGPPWWRETAMHDWLLGVPPADPAALGPARLPTDVRTHVALDPDTLTARNGQLFQSSGPDFESHRHTPGADLRQRGWHPTRHALLARFSEPLEPTLVRLGGEARLAAISVTDAWPKLPPGLASRLAAATRIRLILATPALFAGGWRPGWLDDNLTGSPPAVPGLRLRLRAVALDRWQPVSGWDIQARRAKAVRRLVPAGSVYWFDVLERPAAGVESLWLAPISDAAQDRCDGFGLALPGLWTNDAGGP
jgi:CRISPR-associated protein Cmr3